jgi:hypothetical protein
LRRATPVTSSSDNSALRVFAALGLVGVIVILICTPYGVGIANSDSVNYAKAAESLARGQGYVGFDGAPFVRWPPLFPTLIAVPVALGARALDSMRLVNALAFGLTVFASGLLFARVLASKALALLGTLAVLLSWPLILSAYFAFAETVFALLIVLFLLRLSAFRDHPSPQTLSILALVAALACLQRYLGVAVVLGGGIAILVLMPAPLSKRLIYAASFGVLSGLPLALWGLRNYALVGSFVGGKWTSTAHEMHRALDILVTWLWPEASVRITDNPALGVVLMIGIMTVLSLAALLLACRARLGSITREHLIRTPITPAAVFMPAYSLVFIGLAANLAVSVNDRMLAPMYAPIMLLLFSLADSGLLLLGGTERVPSGLQPSPTMDAVTPNRTLTRSSAVRYSIVLLVALWLVRPALKVVKEVSLLAHDDSAMAFSNLAWQHDAFAAWLNEHPLDGTIYSNAALPLSLMVDHDVHIAPKEADGWTEREAGETVLVWYHDVESYGCTGSNNLCFNTDYAPQDLALTVEPLIETDAGGIYRLNAMVSK